MIKERKIENDSLFPDDTQVELGSFHPFKDLN
jgi:hypothetical protein